jgi:uncharacterized membrane protein
MNESNRGEYKRESVKLDVEEKHNMEEEGGEMEESYKKGERKERSESIFIVVSVPSIFTKTLALFKVFCSR